MRPILSAEIRALEREIEKLKAQRFDPLRMVDRVPEPAEFGQSVLGARFDAWQASYMDAACSCSRFAIAACRQSGKSTVTGLFVAWCLLFIPNFQCLVASRSLRQAAHYLTAVRHAVLSVIPREAMISLNRLSMELPNGSQIISIPCAQPDAGRGFSPHLVVLDEAAFAPEPLFRAISPSLGATDGALHMLSSPNGRQGYFFEAFEGNATDVFRTLRVSHRECPRITAEFLAAERIALGELYFRQEYDAEFITPYGAFFGFSAIRNLEEGEDVDLSDLDVDDMSELLDDMLPVPEPTKEDLQVAFDTAERVRRVLYED